jgi:Protein of unknown function (DUF4058)
MQPVRSVKNQYVGLNAHLHSFWQATGTWNRFHNAHITHLVETLQAQLLPLGYMTEMEESLQIRHFDPDRPRRPKSDVIVYDTDPKRAIQPLSPSGGGLTVAEFIEEEDVEHPYFAAVIYPFSPDLEMGDAVAWIELLSPTNKGESDDAYAYIGKRRALLDTGLVFVEIDYLHETPPTFPRLPDYSKQQAGAHPYRIVVLDPRPDFKSGPVGHYEFDVDEHIPTVKIPLNAGDSLEFDFGLPYREMFERGFYGYKMDFTQLPLNFERYSADDQTRIARRMVAVLEAAQNGLDLETGPFLVEAMRLEAALARIEALRGV